MFSSSNTPAHNHAVLDDNGRFKRFTTQILSSIREGSFDKQDSNSNTPTALPDSFSIESNASQSAVERKNSEDIDLLVDHVEDQTHSTHESLFQRRTLGHEFKIQPTVTIGPSYNKVVDVIAPDTAVEATEVTIHTSISEPVFDVLKEPATHSHCDQTEDCETPVMFSMCKKVYMTDDASDDKSVTNDTNKTHSEVSTESLNDFDIDEAFMIARCALPNINLDQEPEQQSGHSTLTKAKSLPPCNMNKPTYKDLDEPLQRPVSVVMTANSVSYNASYYDIPQTHKSKRAHTIHGRTKKSSTVLRDSSERTEGCETNTKPPLSSTSRVPSIKKKSQFLKTLRKSHNNDNDLLDAPDGRVETSTVNEISRLDAIDGRKNCEPQSAPVLMAHQDRWSMKRVGNMFRASVIAVKNASDEHSQSESDSKGASNRDENFNVVDLTSDDPNDYKAYIRKMSYGMHAKLGKSLGLVLML